MSFDDTRLPVPESSPPSTRRSPAIWLRALAVVTGLVFAIISAALGLAAFALLVYPTNVWVAVIVGVIVVFAAAFFLNLLRRALFRLGSRKLPLTAIITTGILATLMVAIFWIPSKTPESTGSVDSAYGVPPELIEVHTGDEVAVYIQSPTKPNGKDPILYITGGPGAYPDESVKDYLQAYVDLGYTTYTYDPIGVRESPRAASPSSYSMAHETGVVEDILDHYGVAQVNLIANSFGGNIAARFIEEEPDRVNAYLSVDTAPVYSMSINEPGQDPETFTNDMDPTRTEPAPEESEPVEEEAPAEEAAPKEALSLREQVRMNILAGFLNMTGIDRLPYGDWAELDYFISAQFVPPNDDGTLNYHLYTEPSALLNTSVDTSPDFTKHLKEMTSPPVLVVHPEYGIVPWQVHEQYRKYFSDTHFVTAPGAGHGIWASESGLKVLVEAGDALFSGKPIPNEYTSTENPFPPLDQ